MTANLALIVIEWLCAELVDALLRPVWLRYIAAKEAGQDARAERYFRAFTRLVDAAPCWPCRIEYSPDGPLWITTSGGIGMEVYEVGPQFEPCSACGGRGEWETECCNGAGGCDCGGQVVPMGMCLVCRGAGEIQSDLPQEARRANINSIRGRCFIGRGPTSGYWAGR